MVSSSAFSISSVSSIMATTGLAAFVVQEPLEVMGQFASFSSLMPTSTTAQPGTASPLGGAEITTFLAPASACSFAFAYAVKKPVDSTTTSICRRSEEHTSELQSQFHL